MKTPASGMVSRGDQQRASSRAFLAAVRSRRLREALLGGALLWGFFGLALAGLIAREETLVLWLLAGVLLGAAVGGFYARVRMELGPVFPGAVLSAWGAATLECCALGGVSSALAMGLGVGLGGVGLCVYFAKRTGASLVRGRLLRFSAMLCVLAAALGWLGFAFLDAVECVWSGLFLAAGAGALLVLWEAPEHFLLFLSRLVAAVFYRLRLEGVERLPAGGALVISNHLSYVDAVVLQLMFPRKLWFFSVHGPKRTGFLNWLYRVSGVIPLSSERATSGLRLAIRRMREGDLVCVFPEGQVSRTGALMEIRHGFEKLAHEAAVPVVPVFIDSLWGSVFSYSNQRIFWKLPDRLPIGVRVWIGEALPGKTVDALQARQALLDLGEQAYEAREELRGSIGAGCVRSLARHPWRVAVVDRTAERREVSCGKLLAVAAAYAAFLKKTLPEQRVGIVLPPGAGAAIANLAVVLAGKIPVNLNFTAGREALESSMRLGGVRTVISAAAMRSKLPNFPWPEATRDVKNDLVALGKGPILARLVSLWIFPWRLLCVLWGVAREGDRREAGLLFTSGSSGEPKGVALSHRNILANTSQIAATGVLPKQETLLACLPIFHSFGFTVTLWYALLRGMRVVTLPSPLDAGKIIEAIEAERVGVFLGTPTFIRPIVKKAEPAQLRSLRFIIAGAEKLPSELYDSCLEKFGVKILQGYGLTETSPVVSVNTPEPPNLPAAVRLQEGNRLGSVGRLLAGITVRVRHPDSGEELPPGQTGILCFRGPNMFGGYLDDPAKTAEAIQQGWFVTGDLGRLDTDGFMYIEGRLSRFSKIGGEMVPHQTVEQRIIEAFALDTTEGQPVVVLGVPDAAKGEALVLLTTAAIEGPALREKLSALGLPNLWIPKLVQKIDAVPLLGTGKLDLKACKQIAVALSKNG